MFRWVDFNFFRTARTIWVRSRQQRLPGLGREQGQLKELISGQSCKNKAVGDEKLGWIKMFPDLQDHLVRARSSTKDSQE